MKISQICGQRVGYSAGLLHMAPCSPSPRPAMRRVGTRAAVVMPHIAESWILMGSAAVSLSVPTLISRARGYKVDTLTPADALVELQDMNSRLIDIRTRADIRRDGVPFSVDAAETLVIHAPKLLVEGGKSKRNVHFEDEVLFAEGVHADTSFVILDSHGDMGQKAAQAIAKLGNNHDICVIQGGFQAWKAAGLPTQQLHPRREKHYFCKTLTMQSDVRGGQQQQANEVLVSSGTKTVPIFRPKLLDVLASGYGVEDLKQDVLAGMTVGVIALSLSMALGIASESTPAIGLYTAVISGFIISALGGSKVVVGGPTAAFIPIVVGIAHQYGPEGLIMSTAMAGAMLIGMGVTGLGSLVKFVPKPVVTGFTAGIATYIFSTQIKDFLGMGVPGHLPAAVVVPSEFIEKLMYLGSNVAAVHGPSAALAVACLILMKVYPANWAKSVPPQIAAVVAGTLGLALLEGGLGLHTQIETIGSHFGAGAIPSSLPAPHLPAGFSMDALPELVKPATTIALLASIESLLCARVSDTFIGDRHNPNTELIAQGLANIASAAFGGLPATGALARTAANVRAGGKTPVSGMVHAITILAVILMAAPLAEYIPLPTLSAVLVVVAINMGEWHNFKLLPSWPERDAQLFLVAFMLTLLQDVSVAIEVGMAAALLLFVNNVTTSMHVRAVPPGRRLFAPSSEAVSLSRSLPLSPPSLNLSALVETDTNGNGSGSATPLSAQVRDLSQYTMVQPWSSITGSMTEWEFDDLPVTVPHYAAYLEVTGALLFGAGDMLEDALEEMHSQEPVQVVLLDMSHVPVMDVSGLEVMEEQHKRLHRAGKQLVICGLCRQPLRMLSRAGFLDEVGRANVCRSVRQAVQRAAVLVQESMASGEFENVPGFRPSKVAH